MAKTILVADDSKTMRHVIELTFLTTDFKVVAVDSAMAAMERARAERPDVILADIGMPGTDGYKLCQTLKSDAATAGIPVLLMAGAFEAYDEGKAQAARADGHIKKPFETGKLIDQVKALAAAPAPAFKAPVAEPKKDATLRPSFDPFAAPPAAAAKRVEDDIAVDEDMAAAVARPGYGPALEPPTPPNAEAAAAKDGLDVWALQDDAAPGSRLVPAMAGAVAAQAAAAAPGLPRDVLLQAAREVVEQIAWEVVPELAETIIREEIRRLLAERAR